MNYNSLLPDVRKGVRIQCLPLYSILLALGNPTVNFFRHSSLSVSAFSNF
jgi:hypothetical protein